MEKEIGPRIYHFTQSGKPWMGECEPWKEIHPLYREFMDSIQPLELPYKIFTPAEVARENNAACGQGLLPQARFLVRAILKRRAIRKYEENAWF